MAEYAQEDIFGDNNGAPAPAVVEIPGSPSENSSTIMIDDYGERCKGSTTPLRHSERLTMQQKLNAILHFHVEKNLNDTEGAWWVDSDVQTFDAELEEETQLINCSKRHSSWMGY